MKNRFKITIGVLVFISSLWFFSISQTQQPFEQPLPISVPSIPNITEPSIPPTTPPIDTPIWYMWPEGYSYEQVGSYPNVAGKDIVSFSIGYPAGSQYAENLGVIKIRGKNIMQFEPNMWVPAHTFQNSKYLLPIAVQGYGGVPASYDAVTGDLVFDVTPGAIQNQPITVSGTITFRRV